MSQPFGSLPDSQKVTLISMGGVTFAGWDTASDGIREVFSRQRDENRGLIRILIDWEQRIPFAAAMLGNTLVSSGGNVYTIPLSYPDFRLWICQKIEVRGVAPQGQGQNGMLAFQYADLSLFFGVPEYGPGSTTGVGIVELNTSGQAIAVDQSKPTFFWNNDGTNPLPPAMAPALRWTSTLVTIDRIDLPALPLSIVQSLVDHTNAASFQGAAAETVLFHGARSKWKLTAAGAVNYDASYILEIHSVTGGWNKAPKPGSSPLWQPFYLSDGSKLFPTADFSPITL